MADEMIRVVTEYGVDWLKWDYNMGYGLGCDAPDHGHQPTDGHHAHTLGLYQVLAELRAACPDLMIENCASGGHRVDLGTLRHTHTNWVSDYTHRAASCRQHVQGAGLVLPLAHLNTWTLEDRDTSGFRSRMGGAFGVSSFMGRWTGAEREQFGEAVREYRRLRPYLAGERWLLSGPWHGDWDVWQLVHPNGEDIAILAFRDGGAIEEIRLQLRLGDADRIYRLERSSGAAEEIAAPALAADGLRIALPEPGSSEIAWLTALPDAGT
jgi:alpha-galactosidase